MAEGMCRTCGMVPGGGKYTLCKDCLNDFKAHQHAENLRRRHHETYYTRFFCTQCGKRMTESGRCYECSTGRKRTIQRAEERAA